tara:strand:+ start:314 stop:601 length:288 start_codon:yes stop_codon:yes gene_type:complete
MKMTQEHLAILQNGIDSIFSKYSKSGLIAEYEHGKFPRADKTRDLQKRFCFDLFFATGIRIGDGVGTDGDIIGDYSDANIYTALKSICPTLYKRY